MRILMINELSVKGGTEVQTHREKAYFREKGHEVFLLTFDESLPVKLTGNEVNYPNQFRFASGIYHKFFIDKQNVGRLREIIDGLGPDVIHINNVWKAALDVMEAVGKYPVVQTIRDYGAVCPKATCVHEDGMVCRGYENEDCRDCIRKSVRLRLKYRSLRKFNQARKKAVDYFVSPSQALADMCSRNLLPTACLNNPFDFSKIKNSGKVPGARKVFLYYGMIAPKKGVDRFLEVLRGYRSADMEVWFAGEIEKGYGTAFLNQAAEIPFVSYLGVKSFDEIMELYPRVYCVVVPSYWIENYPNTALEAVANKTIVIGSGRGGIPEIIRDERLLFDILDLDSFRKCLDYVLQMGKEEYGIITEQMFEYLQMHNTQERYYERLLEIYRTIGSGPDRGSRTGGRIPAHGEAREGGIPAEKNMSGSTQKSEQER